ncbi:hypothetical protein PC116_g14512 [Phytophthora cactorum]|nr:hypothetical protein PC119_g16592 [Phytophthora cactorum]KAG3148374.1 hypothetical protein C6341_g17421 [Phytophthora cactorum]KAG3173592.1 hypothetical protein PC128_g18233 [Phytophthora cactorum]KAG4237438.1 hypothetical protein PC116_g14512 [Phytophthora cactorum]
MDPRRDYTVINVQEVDANPGDEYRAIEHHENRTSSLHVSGTYEDWIRPGVRSSKRAEMADRNFTYFAAC